MDISSIQLWGAKWISGHAMSKEIFWSLGIIALASIAGRIQFNRIRGQNDKPLEVKRAARARFRNGLILASIGLLGFVWGGEIRSLILSVAAIAAAIMIVSKELISCFYGSLVFTIAKPAKIGDQIEISGLKGELLDHNWYYLTLMEIADSGYYSGKITRVPTSLVLTAPLHNHTQAEAFGFCSMQFHVRSEHAMRALNDARQAAASVCSEWIAPARAHFAELRDSHMAQTPDAEAKASLVSADKDSASVLLRFACPKGKKASAQAKIAELFYSAHAEAIEEEKRKERESRKEQGERQ